MNSRDKLIAWGAVCAVVVMYLGLRFYEDSRSNFQLHSIGHGAFVMFDPRSGADVICEPASADAPAAEADTLVTFYGVGCTRAFLARRKQPGSDQLSVDELPPPKPAPRLQK